MIINPTESIYRSGDILSVMWDCVSESVCVCVCVCVLTIPELKQASNTLMWMFLRRSQLLSELFIHRRHSEPGGTEKASQIAFWIDSTHTHTHTGLHPNPNPYPNLTQSDFIPTKFSNREQKHVYTHTHTKTNLRMLSARLNCEVMTFSMLLWRQRKISTG